MNIEKKYYEIRTVLKNKGTGQKVVTLPKNTNLQEGEYVLVKKVDIGELENGNKE